MFVVGNRQFGSVEELKKAILDAWKAIESKVLENLVGSINNRLFQVINHPGGVIDY